MVAADWSSAWGDFPGWCCVWARSVFAFNTLNESANKELWSLMTNDCQSQGCIKWLNKSFFYCICRCCRQTVDSGFYAIKWNFTFFRLLTALGSCVLLNDMLTLLPLKFNALQDGLQGKRLWGWRMRGAVADLCAAAADGSRSLGLSSGCCSIRESRRSFEVCTCGLESKHCLRHRSNCVWWAVYVWGPGEVRRCTSHHSGRVAVIDLEAGHGFDDGHHRLDGVTVDHRSVLLTLVLWVAVFMDDPENVCKKVQPVAHFS